MVSLQTKYSIESLCANQTRKKLDLNYKNYLLESIVVAVFIR